MCHFLVRSSEGGLEENKNLLVPISVVGLTLGRHQVEFPFDFELFVVRETRLRA